VARASEATPGTVVKSKRPFRLAGTRPRMSPRLSGLQLLRLTRALSSWS